MLFLLAGLFSLQVSAVPLGTIPEIISGSVRANLDLRSDAWTSPTEKKHAPLRIFSGEVHVPIVHNDKWTASGSLINESVSLSRTDLVVGEDNIQIGTDLRYQSAGVALNRRYRESDWSQLAMWYESASDEPFTYGRDVNLNVIGFHAFSRRDRRQWVIGVDHSNNRGYLNGKTLPLIGVIYDHNENTQFIFSFPLFRVTHKSRRLWVSTFTLSPVLAEAHSQRRVAEETWIFARAGISAWSYMHTERSEDKNRLFFEEISARVGMINELSQRVTLYNAIGCSFERKIYEGRKVYERQGDQHRIGSDLFISMRLEFSL